MLNADDVDCSLPTRFMKAVLTWEGKDKRSRHTEQHGHKPVVGTLPGILIRTTPQAL